GAGGGEVVCTGTPEEVAACDRSFTGQALRKHLPSFPRSAWERTCRRSASRLRRGRDAERPGVRAHAERGHEATHLIVQGAQQHNLNNTPGPRPREHRPVGCAPSGGGKTPLALDTISAEGQRRYVEPLSSYARQFLGQVQKPKVEHVSGLSPA